MSQDLPALVEQAKSRRAELAAFDAQAEAYGQLARTERSRVLPQVALSGGYQYLENQFLDDETVGMAGIGVQWALFDGGQSRKRAAALDRNRRATEQQRADASSQIELQVRQAYLGIQESRQRVIVTAQAAEQADENLRIARERYTAGLGTQTQLLQAETLRVQALRNRDDAIAGRRACAAAARSRRRGALKQRVSGSLTGSARRTGSSWPPQGLTRFVNRTEELCDSRRSSLERERGDGASGEATSLQCRLAPALELRRSTWGGQEVPARRALPLDSSRQTAASARPQRATEPLLPERRRELRAVPDLLARDEHRRDHAVRAIDELLVLEDVAIDHAAVCVGVVCPQRLRIDEHDVRLRADIEPARVHAEELRRFARQPPHGLRDHFQ